MDHKDVGRMWDDNAEAWTKLAREGYDVFRDFVNTPAFLSMLPDVSGLSGLDIGCGEGHNTRLISERGANMTALDISKTFIGHASQLETQEPHGIHYLLASGVELPFLDSVFDFAVAIMSLMDMPEQERAIREACRVLKPGGFLQFSITHPCFQTARWKLVPDENGKSVAVECGDYFDPPPNEIEEWTFRSLPPELEKSLRPFRVPLFRRTLSSWMNLLLETGFTIERLDEPHADEATIRKCPDVADTRIIAFFLTILCRKS